MESLQQIITSLKISKCMRVYRAVLNELILSKIGGDVYKTHIEWFSEMKTLIQALVLDRDVGTTKGAMLCDQEAYEKGVAREFLMKCERLSIDDLKQLIDIPNLLEMIVVVGMEVTITLDRVDLYRKLRSEYELPNKISPHLRNLNLDKFRNIAQRFEGCHVKDPDLQKKISKLEQQLSSLTTILNDLRSSNFNGVNVSDVTPE